MRRRSATYRDVLAAPRHMIAEIIRGELRLSPRPAFPHTTVASLLFTLLSPPFTLGHGGGPGGWLILFEPELHFRRDIVVPDLAGWRNARLPAVPDVAYLKLAPDWLCEVHSRSTRKNDIFDKLPIYAAAGVRNVWLIHPQHRTLEVLRLQRRQWKLLGVHRDDQVVRAEPFDAIELDLGILWARLATTGRSPRASEGRDYQPPRIDR